MLCEKCAKNQATIFVTKEVSGVKEEYYLCPECAKLTSETENKDLFNVDSDERVCTCGTSLKEIKESGFLGCPNCYKTFQVELEPIILSLHGHTKHIGKKALSKKEMLIEQIKKAKENNFFDLAKKLQREIDDLNGGKA